MPSYRLMNVVLAESGQKSTTKADIDGGLVGGTVYGGMKRKAAKITPRLRLNNPGPADVELNIGAPNTQSTQL